MSESPNFSPEREESQEKSPIENPYQELNRLELEASSYEQSLEAGVEELRQTGTPEQVEEAVTILERFRQMARKEIQALILAVAVLSPNASYAEDVEQLPPHVSMEQVEHAHEADQQSVIDAISHLRSLVWDDDKESLHVLLGNGDGIESVVTKSGQAGTSTVGSNMNDLRVLVEKFDELKQGMQPGDQMVRVILHNHPAEVAQSAFNYADERLQEMKEGAVDPVVLPPSVTDLFEQYHSNEETQLDTVGYVIEPSGTWRYDFVESHKVLATLDAGKDMLYEKTEEVMRTHVEQRIEQARARSSQEISQQEAVEQAIRDMDNGQKELSEKLLQCSLDAEKQTREALGEAHTLIYTTLPDLTMQIRKASYNGEDVTDLIREYISINQELGVHIDYVGTDGTHISYTDTTSWEEGE